MYVILKILPFDVSCTVLSMDDIADVDLKYKCCLFWVHTQIMSGEEQQRSSSDGHFLRPMLGGKGAMSTPAQWDIPYIKDWVSKAMWAR